MTISTEIWPEGKYEIRKRIENKRIEAKDWTLIPENGRETDRQRDRERQRETERDRERQRDRETKRLRDGEI